MTSSIEFNVRIDVSSGQWLFRKDELFNGIAADEMLLNDAFKNVGRDGVIPGPIGIHNGNGSMFTDPQAVGLGAVHAAVNIAGIFRIVEIQLVQPPLQVIPRFETDFSGRTLRFRGIGAQKDMPLDFSNSQSSGYFGKMLFDVGTHKFYFALRV